MGAILLNQGETYVVEKFNLKTGMINVSKEAVDYHTEARKTIDVKIIEPIEEKEMGNLELSFGELEITELYTNYSLIRNEVVIDIRSLD